MEGRASGGGLGEIETAKGVWVCWEKWSKTGFGGRAWIAGGAAYIIRQSGDVFACGGVSEVRVHYGGVLGQRRGRESSE